MIKIKSQTIWEITFAANNMKGFLCLIYIYKFIQIDQENIIIPLIKKMDNEFTPPQEAKYVNIFLQCSNLLKQDSVFVYQINTDFNADIGTAKQPLIHY